MVPHLKATAVAVTLLGVCGLGTADIAYGQVGVESAIVNSGAATPAKPLKMSGSGPIQVTIGSPATAEASRDTSIKGPNCVGACARVATADRSASRSAPREKSGAAD